MMILVVNGKRYQVDVSPNMSLLWVLRKHLHLTGTKCSCELGLCGACTVHLNGQAEKSCLIPVTKAQGKKITTIEGIPLNHPIIRAWIQEKVSQCGYCQSGQIMQAAALLAKTPYPSEEQISEAMNGNVCRCGSYPRIKKAIQRAASYGMNKGETEENDNRI